jgi:PAS domain S-box-containing protein
VRNQNPDFGFGQVRAKHHNVIVVGATLALALLAVLGYSSYRTLEKSQDEISQVNALHSTVDECEQLGNSLQQTSYAASAYQHTGDSRFAVLYKQQKANLENNITRLRRDLSSDPAQMARLNSITTGLAPLLAQLDDYASDVSPAMQGQSSPPAAGDQAAVNAAQQNADTVAANRAASETVLVREPRDWLLAQITTLEQEQRRTLEERQAAASQQMHDALMYLGGGMTAMLLLLSIAASLLVRNEDKRHRAEMQLRKVSERHRTVYNSTGEMILSCNLAGKIGAFNPAAERMLGYTSTDVIGTKTMSELFGPGEIRRLAASLSTRMHGYAPADQTPEQVIETFAEYTRRVAGVAAPPELEIVFKRANGTVFAGLMSLSAIRNIQGDVTGFVVIASDATARRNAEAAARESQERYRDLFEQTREMVATLDDNGNYLYANPAWMTTLGYVPEGMSKRTFAAAFVPEYRDQAAELLGRVMAGEQIPQVLLRLCTEKGICVDVEANLSRREEQGGTKSVRCLGRDVTESRRRERRLQAQLAVSQVIANTSTFEQAIPKVLEALGNCLGWDVADMWMVDDEHKTLRWEATWSVEPGRSVTFGQDSFARVFDRGEDLPGQIWEHGVGIWMEDIGTDPRFTRRDAAASDGLHTGWGVPIRVGNRVIATLQFYGRTRTPEDSDLMVTTETAGAMVGQFIARCLQDTRLQEVSRQKESILNSVAEGIFGTDPRGNVVFVNPSAAALIGATSADLIGRNVHSILHGARPADQPCGERCRLIRALQSLEGSGGQDTVWRNESESFPVDLAAVPIIEHGTVVGTVLTLRDISQRYALDRLKDEFVSTVSHELRTPLTSIRGALGLLSSGMLGHLSDKAGNLLRIAVTNTDRLIRLINDILDLERMESGRAPLFFRPVNLTDLVQQALDTMQAMAESHGVQMVYDPVAITVEADADRILQVLTNLLSNAIKFSSPGSQVRVRTQPLESQVKLQVIDEGRGVPAEKLESIFDRFQQVDATDSKQKGGTGLGLAICRTILIQHSGRIWAERNGDRGTIFNISLPWTQSSVIVSDGSLSPVLLDKPQHPEETVLICDDDPVARSIVRHHLEQHGYLVLEAERGEVCLSIARQQEVNAILLDLKMPGMSGWETLNRLKIDPHTSGIPVVVLSMQSPQETLDLPGEIHGWVQKPASEQRLLAELGHAIHGMGEKTRVLLVEDDTDLAGVLVAGFERLGVQVDWARTRLQAIDLCQRLRPDLLILDLSLPDGGGWSIVDWLRQHYELHKLPLMVYSARELSEDEMHKLRLGPTQFLTKAKVPPEEVETLVLTMLRRRRDREQLEAPTPVR